MFKQANMKYIRCFYISLAFKHFKHEGWLIIGAKGTQYMQIFLLLTLVRLYLHRWIHRHQHRRCLDYMKIFVFYASHIVLMGNL